MGLIFFYKNYYYCRVSIYSPSLKRMGYWPNEPNTINLNWTTASFDLNDSQTKLRDFDLNILSIRGGPPLYKLITDGYKDNLDCYNVFSLFFRSPSHGGSLTLYSSLWVILVLHLLIIWVPNWVPVPSDILFGFLSCGGQGSIVRRFSPHKCG